MTADSLYEVVTSLWKVVSQQRDEIQNLKWRIKQEASKKRCFKQECWKHQCKNEQGSYPNHNRQETWAQMRWCSGSTYHQWRGHAGKDHDHNTNTAECQEQSQPSKEDAADSLGGTRVVPNILGGDSAAISQSNTDAVVTVGSTSVVLDSSGCKFNEISQIMSEQFNPAIAVTTGSTSAVPDSSGCEINEISQIMSEQFNPVIAVTAGSTSAVPDSSGCEITEISHTLSNLSNADVSPHVFNPSAAELQPQMGQHAPIRCTMDELLDKLKHEFASISPDEIEDVLIEQIGDPAEGELPKTVNLTLERLSMIRQSLGG